MSASPSLRRTLLTTTGTLLKPTYTTPRIHSRFPITAVRPFSATMGKAGVHNLKNKADFDNALSEKGKLMVLDCFATWCGPCKAIAPKVVEFSDTYTDVVFYKVDVDDVPEVAQELGVRAMPTFFLFKDGEKVTDIVGANPGALEAAIKQHK